MQCCSCQVNIIHDGLLDYYLVFDLLSLTPLSAIFQLYHCDQF